MKDDPGTTLTCVGTFPDPPNGPVALAGLSRLLAANDWQRQSGPFDVALAEGEAKDRNVWLWAHDPLHFANGAIVDGDRAVKVSENS